MPVTNYYTVDGQMIGYKDAAGRKDFLTDALGSVTAEVDQTGATKTFDGRYKPYGGDLSSTGTRGSYGWVGSWGYRGTALSATSHYVRARHYSKASGVWTSVDQYWPYERSYAYVAAKVVNKIDYSGYRSCSPGCCTQDFINKNLEGKQSHCAGGTWGACPDSGDLKKKCLANIAAGSTSCDQVKKWIDGALRQCIKHGSGDGYDDKSQWAGTNICCQDIEGSSAWKHCGTYCCSSNMSGNPCWDFCLVRHEEYHGKQCTGTLPGNEPSFPEPCAYLTQAKCMFTLFQSQCKLKWDDFDNFFECKRVTPQC